MKGDMTGQTKDLFSTSNIFSHVSRTSNEPNLQFLCPYLLYKTNGL